jgi:hypothetical protein
MLQGACRSASVLPPYESSMSLHSPARRLVRCLALGPQLAVALAFALTLVTGVVRAQELPSPQQLAARHDSLIGGRLALEGHRSLKISGAFTIPDMGIDAPLEILKLRPKQYLLRVTLGPMGEILSGFDGKVAWAVQPGTGAMLLDGEMATQVSEQADFFGDLHDYTRFTSVTTLAETSFQGKRVHPVQMIRPSGDTLVEYFDIETGLSAGSRTAVSTPMGRIESTSVVGDYKTFNGLTLATRIEQRNPQYRLIITIANVEFDTLDEAALAPPESVKALIKPE